jgi:hypothetical protein
MLLTGVKNGPCRDDHSEPLEARFGLEPQTCRRAALGQCTDLRHPSGLGLLCGGEPTFSSERRLITPPALAAEISHSKVTARTGEKGRSLYATRNNVYLRSHSPGGAAYDVGKIAGIRGKIVI